MVNYFQLDFLIHLLFKLFCWSSILVICSFVKLVHLGNAFYRFPSVPAVPLLRAMITLTWMIVLALLLQQQHSFSRHHIIYMQFHQQAPQSPQLSCISLTLQVLSLLDAIHYQQQTLSQQKSTWLTYSHAYSTSQANVYRKTQLYQKWIWILQAERLVILGWPEMICQQRKRILIIMRRKIIQKPSIQTSSYTQKRIYSWKLLWCSQTLWKWSRSYTGWSPSRGL